LVWSQELMAAQKLQAKAAKRKEAAAAAHQVSQGD
jgi:hypothetical protein